MDKDSEEEAVGKAMGVLEAAATGMLVHLRPAFEEKIKAVLEQNEGIVDQRPEALDHLAAELFAAVFQFEGAS